MHALAVHVRARLPPQTQGFLIATELDADFLKDGFCVRFDHLDRFVAQQLHRFELAADVGVLGRLRAGSG
jgi:hypothetical protein